MDDTFRYFIPFVYYPCIVEISSFLTFGIWCVATMLQFIPYIFTCQCLTSIYIQMMYPDSALTVVMGSLWYSLVTGLIMLQCIYITGAGVKWSFIFTLIYPLIQLCIAILTHTTFSYLYTNFPLSWQNHRTYHRHHFNFIWLHAIFLIITLNYLIYVNCWCLTGVFSFIEGSKDLR